MAAKQKIAAWSFSRWDDYESCPYKAYCRHVLRMKDPRPPGPALERGRRVHEEAEGYLKGYIKRMPKSLATFKELFKRLKKIQKHLQIENDLGLNKKWDECGWFGKDTWLRIKMDLMYDDLEKLEMRRVKDWKTGRENPEKHRKQLSLYAIGALVTAPKNIEVVDAEMVYLDSGNTFGEMFERKDLDKLKKDWLKKTKKMLSDTTFKPTPSGFACKWCYLSKSKGGPCPY